MDALNLRFKANGLILEIGNCQSNPCGTLVFFMALPDKQTHRFCVLSSWKCIRRLECMFYEKRGNNTISVQRFKDSDKVASLRGMGQ